MIKHITQLLVFTFTLMLWFSTAQAQVSGTVLATFKFNTRPLENVVAESTPFLYNARLGDGFSLTLKSFPNESFEQVIGESNYYFNEKVTVSVSLKKGYNFISWTNEQGLVLSTESSYSFFMPAQDIILYANAELITSLDDLDFMDLLIFPNPAANQFYITANETISDLRIVDMQGKQVYITKPKNQSIQISTENFIPGIYMLSIETAFGTYVRRLIVQK